MHFLKNQLKQKFQERVEACKQEKEKRRGRDRKGSEQALLRAAGMLFAEKGYENTRTLEIAKLAEVNEALIGRYFGGKEGLLTAILKDETAFQMIVDGKRASEPVMPLAEEGKSISEAILIFFKRSQKEAQDKEQSMRISCSRAFVDPEVAEMMRRKAIDVSNQPMVDTLKGYVEKTPHSPKDLAAVAMLINSTSHILNFMGRLIYKMDEKQINRAQEILAEALEDYLKKKVKAK